MPMTLCLPQLLFSQGAGSATPTAAQLTAAADPDAVVGVFAFNYGFPEDAEEAVYQMAAMDARVRVLASCLNGGNVHAYKEVCLGLLAKHAQGRAWCFVEAVAMKMCGSGEGKTMLVFARCD